MDKNNTTLKSLRDFEESFVDCCCKDTEITKHVPYERRGILNIEGFYWWSMVGHFRPDIILESGVYLGRSTEVLARAQQFFNIPLYFAFDKDPTNEAHVREKIKSYKTTYEIRSSMDGFREVLERYPDASVVAVIDGPKGDKPLTEVIKICSKFKNCRAVMSHDCMPESKIPPVFINACRKYWPNSAVLITNPKMNERLEYLNDFILKDMATTYSEKQKGDIKIDELLTRSHYVGLCFCQGVA